MKLVYEKTGKLVKVGDIVTTRDKRKKMEVVYFAPPHKPASSGLVTIRPVGSTGPTGQEYYVNVIGAKWIEREDQGWSSDRPIGDVELELMAERAMNAAFYQIKKELGTASLECFSEWFLEGTAQKLLQRYIVVEVMNKAAAEKKNV